jgi:hypothetical protein
MKERKDYLLSPQDARALLDLESGGIGHGVMRELLDINKSTLWRYLEKGTLPRATQIAIWCLCQDAALRADVAARIPLKRRGILKRTRVVRLTGHGTGEVERGRGGVFHGMKEFAEFESALCGEKPGPQSGGWCEVDGSINCPRCLKRIDNSPISLNSKGAIE